MNPPDDGHGSEYAFHNVTAVALSPGASPTAPRVLEPGALAASEASCRAR